ncbi:MAG: hypothetical protein LBD60_02095 [Puniceicoccales bacterium]|jgi:glyoxylase-like metal-dependent hydrolase (beta-lactamase superfamily II)|nr:hypothetical protein [Puniceicoccales bacterium]
MKKVLLFIWSICLFLGTVAFGSNLEINIFNVGWGNFVLLRKDDDVLVIDCGKASVFKQLEAKNRLRDILMGDVNCKVVITHDHKDHYSAASVLAAIMQEKNIDFFAAGVHQRKIGRTE